MSRATLAAVLVASLLAVPVAATPAATAGPTTDARPSPASSTRVVRTAPLLGPVVTLTERGRSPDVAVDARGAVTVVWSTHWWNGDVYAVRRSPSGTWGNPVVLGRGTEPQVAADRRGDVTVMWSHQAPQTTTGVQVARRPAGGHWSRPAGLTVDRPAPGYGPNSDEGTFGADAPELAVAPNGDAVVTWSWGSYDREVPMRVQAAYRPAGRSWQPRVNLTPADWWEDARVAIDGSGDVVVVYGREVRVLQSRRRVVGKGWLPAQVLARAGALSGPDSWSVASAGDGDTTVVYVRYDHGKSAVFARHRPASGPWGPQRMISPADVGAWSASVGIDRAGVTTATWSRTFMSIDAVRRPAAGPWGVPERLTGPDTDNDAAQLVVASSGAVLVSWQRYDDGIFAVHRPAGGPWSAPFRVTPPRGAGQYAFAPALGVDGRAFVAWVPGSGTGPVRFRSVTP
ncbi:MAG: hypothetical protein ACTHKG_12990 [Nocardioides sp.]